MRLLPSLVGTVLLLACAGAPPEAYSLAGEPLHAPDFSPERRAELEANLAAARADFEADRTSEEAIIWYGRRLAYLGRYRAALYVFTYGIELHPESAKLLRHRGHRYITLREFHAAVVDLKRARELTRGLPDQVEPDGAPNPHGIPRSTTQTNITYHLGLAHYLRGELAEAHAAYEDCLALSKNDDMRVAASYWLYLIRRRLGRADAGDVLAPIHANMDILENEGYQRLLLFYRGDLQEAEVAGDGAEDGVADATTGYGLGAWKLLAGDEEGANEVFRRIVAAGAWAAFGHIAAEAELERS